MERLPAIVKSRAMGGSESSVDFVRCSRARSDRPTRCFGVLSDLLGVINSRLESVRDSVERRHALAMATPSIWPVAGWLSSSFGTRKDPFTNGKDFHPGLDISADYGQPVLATGDAHVVSRRHERRLRQHGRPRSRIRHHHQVWPSLAHRGLPMASR